MREFVELTELEPRYTQNVEIEEDFLSHSSVFQTPQVRMQGEHKLLWAIFERALSDLFDASSILREEAELWFQEPLHHDPEVTSFQFISSVFGFDTTLLRTKVFAYVARKKD
jgi:hypothetical protein